MVDLEGFKRCMGFLTGTEQSNVDEAVRSRIAQSATSLQSRGCSVQEAFVIFDTNRNGFLDQTEFYRFLVSCDSRVSQRESDLIFAEVSRNSGRVDVNTFAQELRPNCAPTDAHSRFYDIAFSVANINLESFDAQGLANLAWAAAVLSSSSRTRPLLAGIRSAAGAVARRASTVSRVSEARTLACSLLALTWALSFSKELDSELERGIVQAVRLLAGVLDTAVDNLAPLPLTPQSRGLTFDCITKPRVIIDGPGMLVALKPPGWEVDTTADQTEAHCLSWHLQAIRRREDCPVLHCASYGFGFIHRLDVASSGLVLAATTFEGLLWLQFQKAVNRIDREYIVLCYGLDPQPEHVIDADVTVRGWLKASRTLTEDAGLPAESRLRSIAHLRHPAFGGLSAISIQIFTGRRHQIRAHTRWMRHPTVCDSWYSPSDVLLVERDMLGPAPMRAWVRTPRWDGELTAPPEDELWAFAGQPVLTLEPQLAAPEVERLWRLHGPAPEMSLAELIHLNPASGADGWAEAALRRVARRLAPALNIPPDTFRRFNLANITGLSYAEFEGLLVAQDSRMTREDVIALWRLADAEGSGRVDLGQVVSVLRRAQLEGLTQGRPLPQPPASPADRDMILEA
ncbi:unnamed protein product [Symbiodinium sp. CCMP2456]|nr:unnamed protein product [Symbiodinium sp. CCMP2456]